MGSHYGQGPHETEVGATFPRALENTTKVKAVFTPYTSFPKNFTGMLQLKTSGLGKLIPVGYAGQGHVLTSWAPQET